MQANAQQFMLNLKTTIIFDLDGTLVDSAPDLSNAINAMLMDMQRPPFTDELIHSWVGNGAKVLVERALSGNRAVDSQLSTSDCERALSIFLKHYQANSCTHTRLYNGVNTTLAALKSRGYQLHIVTNKPLMFVQPILDKLAIGQYFDLILGAESLIRKKPDPLPLTHVCHTKGVNIEHCVMVGDSKNDILAANAIDMDSIGLTYGYNYGESIHDYHPSIICDEFSQLLDYLPAITSCKVS